MGTLIQIAGVMLVIFGVTRPCSRFDVCSKALYYASYLFFYGQNGFMVLYGGTKGGTGGMPGDRGRQDQRHGVRRLRLCLATLAARPGVVDYACAEGSPRG